MKDLEDKVQELEKASRDANHENDRLRGQVDKMTVELNEYKKRVSLMQSSNRLAPNSNGVFGSSVINNISDVNFQFEFPKFGSLPGPPVKSSTPQAAPSAAKRTTSQPSPSTKPGDKNSPASSSSYGQKSRSQDDVSSFTGNLFSPPLTNMNIANASRGSLDSHFSTNGAASTSSPSASSTSNMGGTSSSCGTSPEPSAQSPMGFKTVDTLTTIGEEQTGMVGTSFDQLNNLNVSDFNWLPQDFQFEPELFGDYREPQENILTSGFDDSFFNDAFDMDFPTAYNLPVTVPAPKKDILAEIDAAKNTDEVTSDGQLLTCNKIW